MNYIPTYPGVPQAVVIKVLLMTLANPKSEILMVAPGSGDVYNKFSG